VPEILMSFSSYFAYFGTFSTKNALAIAKGGLDAVASHHDSTIEQISFESGVSCELSVLL
jgi:hypothetical protein